MDELTKNLPFHFENSAKVNAPAETVCSYLDDHKRLSAHMSQSSWRMAWSRMDIELDALQGQAAGSKIRLSGRVLGIPLAVEELVTVYEPPLRKYWQTVGTPRLLVIGHYRMGFEILPQGTGSELRIFIDYALPDNAGTLRVIAGEYAGTQGAASTYSPVNLWDIKLNAGKSVELAVPEGHNNMLFVRQGRLETGGEVIEPADLVIMRREGTRITLKALEDTGFLLMGGEPIAEPIVASGPFVMNTEQEIRIAMMDYQSGRMGQMAG